MRQIILHKYLQFSYLLNFNIYLQFHYNISILYSAYEIEKRINMVKQFYTPKELSDLTGISVSHLAHLRMDSFKYDEYGNFKAEYFPFLKVGKKVLYPAKEVEVVLSNLMNKGA